VSKRFVVILMLLALAVFAGANAGVAQEKNMDKPMTDKAMKAKVIELVQTPGQFEPQKLELAPGSYIFKVMNKNVDHEVAFYLRQRGPDGKEGKPLPGSDTGRLKAGQSGSTREIELKPGKYYYSCPLNPTPHYEIIVK
jgi:plastocyanin